MDHSAGSMSASTAAETKRAHPLGPLVWRVLEPRSSPLRWRALGTLLVCSALLGTAGWLVPDRRGHGTHEQLGLAPCTMILVTGLPCPTCGMTTAYSLTVRGRLWTAINAQPLGTLLALGTIVLGALSVQELLTARYWRVNWYRITPGKILITCLLLFGSAWLFKIIKSV